MEGRQFSTSRGHSIYLRDFLDRYDPDPLRYYLIAASPETQDTDFTWADFVRRNNDELLANWGNLVNRTLTNAHRNFGAVPEPAALTSGDQARARLRSTRASARSARTSRRGGSALRSARRCGSPRTSTSTSRPRRRGRSSRPTPRGPERCCTSSLRAVDSLKTILTPFLPHTSQQVHELLGYDGDSPAPSSSARSTTAGETHEILTGDYTGWVGSWEPSDLQPGQPLREPKPLFRKLDESIVDEELKRMRDAGAE